MGSHDLQRNLILRTLQLEDQDQQLLDPHVQFEVLFLRQFCVIPLLEEHEPLGQGALKLHRIITQKNLPESDNKERILLKFFIGEGRLAVPATGHLETLRALTLLDVLAIFSSCSLVEKGVPVGQKGSVVTSPLRGVMKHLFLINEFHF